MYQVQHNVTKYDKIVRYMTKYDYLRRNRALYCKTQENITTKNTAVNTKIFYEIRRYSDKIQLGVTE